MLPPEDRLLGAQLHRYVRDKLYWVLHAPRQTGKTTLLQSWMRELNTTDEYVALYVTVEDCQTITDIAEAMRIIDFNIKAAFKNYEFDEKVINTTSDKLTIVSDTLQVISELVAPKPLVVLFDEVDVLEGKPLIRFLRLLRGGFATRGAGTFPISIALVGMRDLKDYITQSKDGIAPNPGSPFNIKADSATLSNFTRENIGSLFAQRTEETGQQITQEALDYVWEQSKGQPWLVNSLFMRATMRVLDEEDYSTVTLEHIKEARHQIIMARETHLDSLVYRLQNPEIRRLIEIIMSGEIDTQIADTEGFRLAQDLGLVVIEKGMIQIANPIYREVMARQITFGTQIFVPDPEWQWQKPDGSLDMDALMKEFQKFWRKHSEIWEQKSNYTEVFPHLLLMAFLQRITNGGGRIDREYAAGRGRMDLFVEFDKWQYIIEIKILHDYDTPQSVREEGLTQIQRYRSMVAPEAPAYLVVFDRRSPEKKAAWDERLSWENEEDGIVIVGG
jgi:GTPase SAR1 family protein